MCVILTQSPSKTSTEDSENFFSDTSGFYICPPKLKKEQIVFMIPQPTHHHIHMGKNSRTHSTPPRDPRLQGVLQIQMSDSERLPLLSCDTGLSIPTCCWIIWQHQSKQFPLALFLLQQALSLFLCQLARKEYVYKYSSCA